MSIPDEKPYDKTPFDKDVEATKAAVIENSKSHELVRETTEVMRDALNELSDNLLTIYPKGKKQLVEVLDGCRERLMGEIYAEGKR